MHVVLSFVIVALPAQTENSISIMPFTHYRTTEKQSSTTMNHRVPIDASQPAKTLPFEPQPE